MSDLHVSGKSTIYDATIRKVGQLPEQPVSNDQDEIYFTLGDDLYVARGRALPGAPNLKLGDWVSVDGKNGEIVRLDIEATPGKAQCTEDFVWALAASEGWQQALEVGVAAHAYLGRLGTVAGDAFSSAIDRCTSSKDGLAIAQAIAGTDDRFFRWQIRSAVRKSLQLARTPEDLQSIAQLARDFHFPLLAQRAERTAASPPQ